MNAHRVLLTALLALTPFVASAQIVVEATIVGADGKPLPMAHAHLKQHPWDRETLSSAAADARGIARLTVPAPGSYTLEFTGVGHRMQPIALFVVGPSTIPVRAQLAAHGYPEKPDTVMVIGDFNEFDFETAQAMKRNADGTFSAEFRTSAPTFRYQVLKTTSTPRGMQTSSINGTQSDDYEYDGGGDYRSVVRTVNGVATIRFDPAKVVRSEAEAVVRYLDPRGSAQLYLDLVARNEAREKELIDSIRSWVGAGHEMDEFRFDGSAQRLEAAQRLEGAREPVARRMAMIEYLLVHETEADSAIAVEALRLMPPTSQYWTAAPKALMVAALAARDTTAIERALVSDLPEEARAQLLFETLSHTHFYQRDTTRSAAMFRRLASEFPKSQYLEMAKSRDMDPDRVIRVGNRAPAFRVVSMEDSTVVFTNETFKGRYVLVDFWAVWCGPCIMEMGRLHEAAEKFRGERFEMLSLSFDDKPETVQRFRERKWKMPWLHAFMQGGFEHDVAKAYEVGGIPKPVLIGPDGIIVADETRLRGKKLIETLGEILGR